MAPLAPRALPRTAGRAIVRRSSIDPSPPRGQRRVAWAAGMLKTLSLKTRRPDLSAAEFRRHYEERHVPLGLGFQDRFGWRKYARNHVARVRSGEVTFDCLTEFWVASAADQE